MTNSFNNVVIVPNSASSEFGDTSIENITLWLKNHKVMKYYETLITYIDEVVWYRSGGETYISIFYIEYIDQQGVINKKKVVLKALVTLFPENTLEKWKERRIILSALGIPVSNWYWYGKGLIVEDFYSHDYTFTNDFSKLLSIAIKLDSAGFHSLNFLNDIRCDELGNPHYVDFGFDLGNKTSSRSRYAITELIEKFPSKITEIQFFERNLQP